MKLERIMRLYERTRWTRGIATRLAKPEQVIGPAVNRVDAVLPVLLVAPMRPNPTHPA